MIVRIYLQKVTQLYIRYNLFSNSPLHLLKYCCYLFCLTRQAFFQWYCSRCWQTCQSDDLHQSHRTDYASCCHYHVCCGNSSWQMLPLEHFWKNKINQELSTQGLIKEMHWMLRKLSKMLNIMIKLLWTEPSSQGHCAAQTEAEAFTLLVWALFNMH